MEENYEEACNKTWEIYQDKTLNEIIEENKKTLTTPEVGRLLLVLAKKVGVTPKLLVKQSELEFRI